MALLSGALLLAGVGWLVWKGTGRNVGTVEQDQVTRRRPHDK